jgi:hypothetical protein
MADVGLIVAYVIFGSLGVAAVVATVWLGGHLVWGGFKSNFLSPALEIVRHLRRKQI